MDLEIFAACPSFSSFGGGGKYINQAGEHVCVLDRAYAFIREALLRQHHAKGQAYIDQVALKLSRLIQLSPMERVDCTLVASSIVDWSAVSVSSVRVSSSSGSSASCHRDSSCEIASEIFNHDADTQSYVCIGAPETHTVARVRASKWGPRAEKLTDRVGEN